MLAATARAAVAVALCVGLAACSAGGRGDPGQVADSPSPSADPSASPSPSVAPTGVNPAVTAAYGALTSSLALIARDVPAVSTAADFRPDLSALNAALTRGRDALAAERAVRYPPDCPRVLANAAVVHSATASALAARSRISARAATVASVSRRVDGDRAFVESKNAALVAALKTTGTMLPPALPALDVTGILTNARAAQSAAAAAAGSASSAAAMGAANATAQDSKASALASGC